MPTKHTPRIMTPVVVGWEGAKVGDFIDQGQKIWKADLVDRVFFYDFEVSIIKKHPLVSVHSR